MKVRFKSFYLISFYLTLVLIVSHPAKANNGSASNTHRSHKTKENLNVHKNYKMYMENIFNYAGSSTVIVPTEPRSFIAKANLKDEILVTDDPKLFKELLGESAKKMKLIGRYKETVPTLNNLELSLNDPKPLNELERLNNNTPISLFGGCVGDNTGRRIACLIHTLRFETEKGFIYKEVNGWVIDKDGKAGLKSKVGFFNRLFKKYKTSTRKPVNGEEIYITVQCKD